MLIPKTDFLDGTNEVKPHGSQLLHHGDQSIISIGDEKPTTMVHFTTLDARNVPNSCCWRITFRVTNLAIVTMLLCSNILLDSA